MDVVEVHGTNVTGPFLNGYHILRRCWDDTIPAQFPLIRVLRAALTVKSMRKEAPLAPSHQCHLSVHPWAKTASRVLRVRKVCQRKVVTESDTHDDRAKGWMRVCPRRGWEISDDEIGVA